MSLTEKTDIRDSDEKVVEIEMERLRTFTNHPFKVIGDSSGAILFSDGML